MTTVSPSLDTLNNTEAGEIVVQPLTIAEREPAPPAPSGSLATEKVPPAMKPQPLPLIRILMPVIMLVMIGGMVALMITRGGAAHPMLLMFPVMMLLSMATMFGNAPSEDIDDTRRAFVRHLGAIRDTALANASQQRAAEVHKHPDPLHLGSFVGSRRMWERAAADPDALEIRIGLGATALCTPVSVADSGAPEDLDPVCAVALRHTVRSVGSVPDMPIAVQLQAFRYVSVGGAFAEELVRAMIMQLAFHHGPECVGLKVRGVGFDWLKWLPHTREMSHSHFRILIVAGDGVEDADLFDPQWTCIIGVGVHEHSELGALAISEGLALTVSADESRTLTVHTEGGLEDIGSADLVTEAVALQCARPMTAYRRPQEGKRQTLDFLGLHGYADVASISAPGLWRSERSLKQQLVVPIGVSETGSPVQLDIKESAHGGVGPHGLCVGATGSGKSELLKSFVLSLALTHSPEELNFVLVDFKGGATFLGLEELPHTSAVITNLAEEASLVERMHDAISGELNRRQEVLRAAGSFANVHDYRKARATTMPHLPPLPALVIVLDEFSELLGQHPDFADLFVAVGRLGRSLQMHLLLASQRLEEGRLRGLDSHLSYRIGLKTFSASESRQVLGVVDAYHLPAQPGAGFLKSDAADVTRFQASYVSGPVPVQVSGTGTTPTAVRLFTGWESDDEDSAAYELDSSRTVLGAVSELIVEAGNLGRHRAHQLWLPPLPEVLPLAGVADQVGENLAAIGVVDRPYLQRQDPFIADLSGGDGHVAVCGGPRSGKTTALRTLVLSLAATHSTDNVRFYVLDLSGTELAALASVPHVAGVANKSQPEKVRRIVDEVMGLVERPEHRHTYLVVDGWHGLTADFDDVYDSLVTIAADGLASRVHLVLSTPRWTQVRPAIRDLMGTRIELRLGEPMDSVINRKAQQKLPNKPGRGLNADGESILIAHSSNQDIGHVILASRSSGMEPVPRLKELPATLSLASVGPGEGIIFGIGGRDLGPLGWDPDHSPHVLCIGGQGSGKSTFLRTIGQGVAKLGRDRARLVILDPRRSHLDVFPEEMVAAYGGTADSIATAVVNTATTLRSRLPGPEVTAAELKARSWWQGPEIYVLIDDTDLITDTALHPLIELIPHSRDIGLHIVIARKSGGIGRALYTQFFAAVKDNSPSVLLLDADADEGRIFGVKPTRQIPGRGVWQVAGTTIGACHVATYYQGEK
ncbi:ESX-1 secretion system protein EccCa1 [Corynebacterium kalinowskii]|uniref:ESX-1 secretion system protein EccCa1 n=1 Tax=Corynebacterium kalinowskii TaxID=2675216 RepID=A0A6B8VN45_9CORY|nr:type VII secretion protein EccCa [Corynebacterium kalinowskii]QGU02834.1 ESX-1 secretion system protein EccCa1 [Corynebacterium kalinowskii]